MGNSDRTVLVTGATGKQGGAVARHLLDRRWRVRAFVRDAKSEKSQALKQLGAELHEGDLGDTDSVEAGMRGVYGVYSFPNMSDGLENEVKQGKLVADSVKEVGVEHFIQASVGGADRNSGVPHFESKWRIEEYVRKVGLPASFLRPVYFMENLLWKKEAIDQGKLPSDGLGKDTKLQMVAANDIGVFAAMMFEDPDTYMGEGLEIAGDELSETETVEVLAKVTNKDMALGSVSPPMNEDVGLMVEWFEEHGYEADIPTLKKLYPDLMNLETWLRKTGWKTTI